MRIDMRPAALACHAPVTVEQEAQSLEALSDWLLTNNHDMKLPDSVTHDPRDVAAILRHLAALACPRAAVRDWVPQIGERVEVTDDTPDAEDWRALSLWVAGVRVHNSGDGLDVTVSEQWPIPSRVSGRYMGQTDDFRVGASSVADMLRPLRSPLGER